MKIVIRNEIELHNAPSPLAVALEDRLTFENPKWIENERLDRWNGNTERWLRCFEDHGGIMVVPRGFARQLLTLCKRMGTPYRIEDQRRILPEVPFSFQGELKPFQEEGVQAIEQRDFGTLSAPTGGGKTVMALALIARRRQPALVIVHTKELLHQWIERIETFLGIPPREVGIIGDGKFEVGPRITVALVQSLYKCAPEVSPYVGHLIIDECHRAPSRTFTEAVTAFDSRYMLGLSATPWRRDKLSRLIFWHVGDVVHQIKKPDLIETGDVLPAEIVWKETDFQPFSDPTTEYTRMLSELTEDRQRNCLIASDVTQEARNGNGIILVLSDRKAHCETLRDLLADKGIKGEVLTGDLSDIERRRIVKDMDRGKTKVVAATGQLIGEGVDCPALSTLFLATPIKFDGRLIQYLGRVLRPAPGKEKAVVYDYLDQHVGVLVAAAKARKRVYANHTQEDNSKAGGYA
jgi:superfamily II DNA or RNA helicase